jgi:soluble lytic murein transglycosylase-like protein
MLMKTVAAITLFVLIGLSTAQAGADIYVYIDNQGVMHFTNVPTSSDYKVYLKDHRRPTAPPRDSNAYDDIISQASRRYDIAFPLLKAIIRAESAFDPKAVSRKGALGLMQIMPENLTALDVNDPFDPHDNIMGGARYFRELLDRYQGKVPLALAAYNAGPSMVDRHRGIPPIKETEIYVQRVMTFYNAMNNSRAS